MVSTFFVSLHNRISAFPEQDIYSKRRVLKPSTLFLLVLLALTAACKTTRPHTEPEQTAVSTTHSSQENTIVFIMFDVIADTTNGHSIITTYDIHKVSGKLKQPLPSVPSTDHYIMGILSDEADLVSDTFYLEHPLYRVMEAVNEHHVMEQYAVELQESQFFVRLQQNTFIRLSLYEFSNYVRNREMGQFHF